MRKFVDIRKTLNRKKLENQAKTIEKVNGRIEKRLKASTLKLTELESDVLVNGIANSDFRDIAGNPDVWSDRQSDSESMRGKHIGNESFIMNGKKITVSPVQYFQTIFAEEGCFRVDLVRMFNLKGKQDDEY